MNNTNMNEWNQALSQQEQDRQVGMDAETQRYGEQVMSDFDNLVSMGNQRRMKSRRVKDATLSAMILQARNNKGFVPPDVLEAASANMGFPVAGGNFDEKGNFLVYSLQRDQNGASRLSPVAIATPEMQFQTLERAKMGVDYRREIYGNLSRRFTPEQLQQRGFTDPDGVHVTGSVTDRGVFARSVTGPERRGGSSFAADGKGGFSRSRWDGHGNRITEDGGTRAPEHTGRWKTLRSGFISEQDAYGTVYENDKTGETMFVRRGETPPWQKPAGNDKLTIEQMKEDGRNSRELIKEEGRNRRAEGQNETRLNIAELQNDTKIEKMKGDFQVRMRNAKTAEERAKVDKEYKAALAEHLVNSDEMGWARLEETSAHNQAKEEQAAVNEEGRNRRASEAAAARGKVGGKSVDPRQQISAMKGMLELARSTGMSNEDLAELETWTQERIKRMTGKEETSNDGGTKGKVSYNDLQVGQTFYAVGKDGKRHKFRKTENNGYERID